MTGNQASCKPKMTTRNEAVTNSGNEEPAKLKVTMQRSIREPRLSAAMIPPRMPSGTVIRSARKASFAELRKVVPITFETGSRDLYDSPRSSCA